MLFALSIVLECRLGAHGAVFSIGRGGRLGRQALAINLCGGACFTLSCL